MLFLAQQEWLLYEYLETCMTITAEGFDFESIRQLTYLGILVDREKSLFNLNFCLITGRVARLTRLFL